FGLLLWYVDKYFAEDGELQSIDRQQSLLIGLIQSLALLPGVSRLGILLTASRGFHLNRSLAGELALVSSIPIVAGAFFVKLCKGFELPSAEMWPLVIWGILFSFLTGLLGIKLLEFVLRKGSLKYVAVYRLLLALAVLVFCGNM
ncbi:undecaprenyl-diphosphate phosphatase, partial [bacterium]|nr:undecaprenyl-diphosphate phosphatase [bacterium]